MMYRTHLLTASCFCVLFSTHAAIPEAKQDKDHFEGDVHKSSYDHDAFVGKDEALEYQNLTPEQSKERLAKLITVMDKDNDGVITEAELIDHIKFMQKRYILKDVERTWVNHGGNKTNKLTWEDYKKTVYGPEDANIEVTDEYAKMMSRDERRWKMADTDGDNTLNKDEYACFMHPEHCDHMKDVIVTETVEDIDKNKDGAVDIEEYINDMYRPDDDPNQKGEPDWVKFERETFKTHRDKNGDGKLDNEELKEWIMPTGFDHAEAEAKHLIQMADENKDRQLSKDEILNHYDVFVGSQATDYGEQLQKHDPSEL